MKGNLKNINPWQRYILKKKLKQGVAKMAEDYYHKATPAMEEVVRLIEDEPTNQQIQIATYLVGEIILGFEEHKHRETIIKLVQEIIKERSE